MNELMNIPKLIHVGCQQRSDTYTGQLAYVIYTDEKGKVRKQTSWEGWRDKKIDPQDFDNEPTSGFVLNKGVGGARNSWSSNARNEYIRVFDPRGFEFEISVANLLFILQECDAYKGKGLEGEFVYAWSGTELVLLPVGCEEYNTSMTFTKTKLMKVTKKEMVEGCVYQSKSMRNWVYLGRHKCRKNTRREEILKGPSEMRHVFWDTENKVHIFERGFTKLAQKVSDEQYPEFADLYTAFVEGQYVSEFAGYFLKPISVEDLDPYTYYGNRFFRKTKVGDLELCRIDRGYYGDRYSEGVRITEEELTSLDVNPRFDHHQNHRFHNSTRLLKKDDPVLEDAEIFTLYYRLTSNKTFKEEYYVEK